MRKQEKEIPIQEKVIGFRKIACQCRNMSRNVRYVPKKIGLNCMRLSLNGESHSNIIKLSVLPKKYSLKYIN